MKPAFETLLYTDCRPDQGLTGMAGLQFQARSSGADQAAMALVQSALLYEPPEDWMRERRPVDGYPPSFGYLRDGSLAAVAAGVYLGQEANGTREGNQLTHAAVTDDPAAAFDTVRPAQLFGASFWSQTPFLTTDCPPVQEGWEPGPYTAGALQEFVRAQPRGPELLVVLVSALRAFTDMDADDGAGGGAGAGPGGRAPRRVLFLAQRPEPVVKWIAAATLLLPMRAALGIGFKIFSTNPTYAPAQVVAVHPDWGLALADPDRDQGYVVVDLLGNRWNDVPPAGDTAAWVEDFLTEDTYDVLDAVEVAAAAGLPEPLARTLAWAAVARRRPPVEAAGALVGWLVDGPADLRAAYADAVADVLVDGLPDWPLPTLVAFDGAGAAGALPDARATTVRHALIEAEAVLAVGSGGVPEGVRPPLPDALWGPAEVERAVRRVLAVGRPESGRSVDAALRLAHRFGLPVDRGRLGSLGDTLLLDWVENPRRDYQPARWPCGRELAAALRDALAERVLVHPELAQRIGDDWWPALLPDVLAGVGPATPDRLDAAVLTSAMTDPANEAGWARLATGLLRAAASATDPVAAVSRLAGVLWERRAATGTEIELLLEIAPTGVSVEPAVFTGLLSGLQGGQGGQASAYDLDLAQEVLRRGLTNLDRPTRELLVADERIAHLRTLLSGPKPSGPNPSGPQSGDDGETIEMAHKIATSPPVVLAARAKSLYETLASAGSARLVGMIVTALPTEWQRRYGDDLVAAIGKRGSPELVAVAFYLGWQGGGPSRIDPDLQIACQEVVERWILRARKGQRATAKETVGVLGDNYTRAWNRIELQLLTADRRLPFKRTR